MSVLTSRSPRETGAGASATGAGAGSAGLVGGGAGPSWSGPSWTIRCSTCFWSRSLLAYLWDPVRLVLDRVWPRACKRVCFSVVCLSRSVLLYGLVVYGRKKNDRHTHHAQGVHEPAVFINYFMASTIQSGIDISLKRHLPVLHQITFKRVTFASWTG